MDQYAGSHGHSIYCYAELAVSFINFLKQNLFENLTTISALVVFYTCFYFYYTLSPCLQCFDAVGWAAGRESGQ